MKLPLFTDTNHCKMRREGVNGLSCERCRGSRRFRESLLNAFTLPGNDVDFDCEYGGPVKDKKEKTPKPNSDEPSVTRQALNVMGHALHGAASIAKTSLGIDRASDEQVEARLNVCRQCPDRHATWKNGDVHTCGPMLQSMRESGQSTCGCILYKKARNLAEDCPFGWWVTIPGPKAS